MTIYPDLQNKNNLVKVMYVNRKEWVEFLDLLLLYYTYINLVRDKTPSSISYKCYCLIN